MPFVRLYNHEQEDITKETTNLRLVYEVDFDNLPFPAQEYIRALCVRDFTNDFTNDPTRMNQAREDVKEAYKALHAQHIRAVGVNLLRRKETAYAIWRSRGTRPYLRNR